MRSYLLGLLASTVIGLASAEDLQPCGAAFYVPSQYTCYKGNKLCPVLNGVRTKPCGEDCYLESAYSCNNGQLAPPKPRKDGVFTLQSGHAGIEANGGVLRVGGEPATYCPPYVRDCPAGKETVFSLVEDIVNLIVEVPGGQQLYVAPNGAVSYTQPHSDLAPPGSSFSGFSVKAGELKFLEADFVACRSADGSSNYQLYAKDDDRTPESCEEVKLRAESYKEIEYGAWQHT